MDSGNAAAGVSFIEWVITTGELTRAAIEQKILAGSMNQEAPDGP